MNSKHTPRPWAHGFSDGSGRANDEQGGWILAGEHPAHDKAVIVVQGGQDEWGVAKGVVNPADAALIVTACNAWDNIDALRARIAELEAA